MQVLAIATQKGGEGKTTTTYALLAGLTLRGFKSLAIDLDSQGNLTNIANGNSSGKNVLDLLVKECAATEAIQTIPNGNLIASSSLLSNIDAILQDTLGKAYKLKKALESIKLLYDYVIIDCPPALGTLTANALTAANYIIIPAQADISSLQGISQLWETINEAREYTNRNLKIAGILLTRYNCRTTLSRTIKKQLQEEIAPYMKTKLFSSAIREAIAIREAKYMQQSIFEYAPKSNVAEDYNSFIDELIENIKNDRRIIE